MKVLSGKESIASVSRPSSIKTNGTDTIASARTDPLMDILLTLQSHINSNMARINMNQKRLLQRSKHVDDLSLKATQAISAALNQSKIASDRLNEAKLIKNQAKQTRHLTTAIFESLSRIQHLLDPEDRVGHAEFERRWPVLHTLHQRASNKSGRPPAFLPSSSSPSSTNINNDSTEQQQQQQKTSTATATINLDTVTPLSSSEIPTASTSSIPPASSSTSTGIKGQQEAQAQNENSSKLVMDRLRSLIGDSTSPETTTATATITTAAEPDGTQDSL
ncbi:hypothetical protein BCR42DRAFT_35206 [Absidia repens]|uniref:BLOC-1-related complex subunit 5 n=1 Tax=Absidia repens TaxID=90262 RepID=A0A1X2IGX1_9FUNG|nr:hypothetical protein BCR42DRAFT_35206 [Absidia repens]